MAKTKTQPVHYVNNKEFSQAVVDYVNAAKNEKDKGNKAPIIPNYIAESFLKIAENLSHKANFIRYTYREEMVMDAVENCLKAIENYNVNATTRTGKPNAFAYFTQIIWYAFLRRITKEKKQQEIKERYMAQASYDQFLVEGEDNEVSQTYANHFVDNLRERIDKVKTYDNEIKQFAKDNNLNTRKKRKKSVDSDLSEFIMED